MQRRREGKRSAPEAGEAPRDDLDAKIYRVVRSIPRGRVATYGEVAMLAGLPSGHRVVASAMRRCPERLPWQRVVGKKDARRGQINIDEPEHAALQRALLEAESVVFDANGFIVLRRSGWSSAPEPARASRAPGAAREQRAKRGARQRTKPR